MKKGFTFVVIALLAAAAGAVIALLALKKRNECSDDDFELTDSVFFEDDEDTDECDDYTCACYESDETTVDEPMAEESAIDILTTPITPTAPTIDEE